MNQVLDLQALAQVGVFLVAVLLGWLAGWLVQRRLQGVDARLDASRLGQNLRFLPTLAASLVPAAIPLLIYGLGLLGAAWLTSLAHPGALLHWLLSYLPYVVFFQLLKGLLQRQMPAEQVLALNRYILQPVLWALLGLHALGMTDSLLAISFQPGQNPPISLRAVLVSLLVLYLFYMAARALRSFLRDSFLPNAGASPVLSQVSSMLLFYTVLVVGFLISLNALGVELTALTVIAGGLSVGIGFGLQALFNNLVSGFIVLLERSVVPGDVVRVGDQVGTVKDIRLRSTVIRTFDELDLVVPNSKFLDDVVVNYTRNPENRRVNVKVGAAYRSDPRQVEQLLMQATEHPLVVADPAPAAFFSGFGDSSLDFDVYVYLSDSTQALRVASDIRFRIFELFTQHGIEIPFPQREVRVRKDAGAESGGLEEAGTPGDGEAMEPGE